MGSTPDPPDPYETANAQSDANYKNAQQNFGFQNVNEYTPYGSKTYAQSGWYDVVDPNTGQVTQTPQYSSTVALSPAEQEILNYNTATRANIGQISVDQSARLQSHLNESMDLSSLQPWQAAAAPGETRQDQTPTDRKSVENAMMERYHRYADPRNEAQNTQMSLRGMDPGSQGYGTQQMAQGDEFTNAAREAYLGSGEESRRAEGAYNAAALQKYQMGADWSAQLNNLRQAQLTEAYAARNQPINEIASLMGLSSPNTPQFQPFAGTTMQAPNIGQYIYDDYNARAQQSSNALSGMFGIGSEIAGALPWVSWLGASDRRMKQDIEPTDRTLAGLPLYWFRYKAAPDIQQMGVMADEVRAVYPEAVIEIDGYDHVDYGLLMRRHVDAD